MGLITHPYISHNQSNWSITSLGRNFIQTSLEGNFISQYSVHINNLHKLAGQLDLKANPPPSSLHSSRSLQWPFLLLNSFQNLQFFFSFFIISRLLGVYSLSFFYLYFLACSVLVRQACFFLLNKDVCMSICLKLHLFFWAFIGLIFFSCFSFLKL